MAETILNTLSRFLRETSGKDIPLEIREQAKIKIIDFLAALGMGMRSGVENPLLDFPRIPSQPEATILYSGKPAPAPHAAACNTYTANSSGMEDGSRFAGAHPSSGIIPPAMSAAQTSGASGPDLITAVVLAYEIYLRIGYALYPHDVQKGFHPSAILAPFGSAAAVSKLLDLDSPQALSALALSCISSSGLVVAFEAYPSKCYQIARGVKGGFEAALLAREGMPGPERAMEEGFLKAYGGAEKIDLEGLGSRFLISQSYLKIHGGCRLIHPCIDAAIHIRNVEGVRPEDVEEILVKTTSVAHAMEKENARNAYEARFNTPFLMAAALMEGEAAENQITEEMLRNEKVRELSGKIKAEIDAELDKHYPAKRGSNIILKTRNGRTIMRQVDFPLGEPENPLPPEIVKQKFMKNLEGVLEKSRVSFLYDFLEDLDNQKTLTPFFETVTNK